MKRLLLFRHGKSDWDSDAPSDHARPLAKRGVRSARAMGRVLARSGAVPDMVLSSPAVRALTTAELAAAAGAWGCPVQVAPVLYGASPGDVVRLVRDQDDGLGSLMLVGHEPTWSGVAALLSGAHVQVKTATVVALDFEGQAWDQVAPGRAEVAWVLQSRMFLGGDWGLDGD